MENVIKVDYHNGISLEEYNGIYGLLSWKAGQNETWFKKYVFLSLSRKGKYVPDERKRVMSVRLGKKDVAIEVLEKILKELKGGK